ncbi:hypothetical protein GGG16DRAFT_68443 [Schizophyllum commune]
MSSTASDLDPVHHDMGNTLSPFAAPSAARLRLMIRDEVRNCLRSEHRREDTSMAEAGKLQGRPGSKGRVIGRAERGRHGEPSEATSSQMPHVDRGRAESLVPIFLCGFIAVIWLVAIVEWLDIHMKLIWELTHIDVPCLGSIPMLRSLSVTFLFVQ